MPEVSEELAELDRRIEAAIRRVPDRLSHPKGEHIRAGWACEFARLLGAEVMPVRMFGLLPFHLHLLTDPLLLRLRTGYLVMDHPENAGEFDWAFELDTLRSRAQVLHCPCWWSLHENRHPRLIVVPDKGAALLPVAELITRLADRGWHGPFGAAPTWEAADSQSPPLCSLMRVEHPVDPAWFGRI
jgi:hypothetical protein